MLQSGIVFANVIDQNTYNANKSFFIFTAKETKGGLNFLFSLESKNFKRFINYPLNYSLCVLFLFILRTIPNII